MKTIETSGSCTWLTFLLVFALLAAGIVAIGTYYYRNYAQHYRAEVERQLSIIADLKVNELSQWRKERMRDGAVFFKNPSFAALVRRFFEKPEDADAQRQIQDWLGKYQAHDDYNQIRLLDAQGVTQLSVPAALEPPSSVIVRGTAEVLRSGQVAMQDFYRNEYNQRIYLAVLVPILDEQEASRPLGVLVLRMDPETYLYPLIKLWPTPSSTAETLLLRRDGNDVLYLNNFLQANAALTLRLPLTRTDVPAVKAVLGQTGIMRDLDYRGVPVIAAVQAVTDSPWFLVAKMDTAEVYAPMRERLWQIVVLIGVLLFGAGASVGLVWRQQKVRFYKERAETDNSTRRMATVVRDSNDAITIQNFEGGITAWNRGAELMYGYSEAEALLANIDRLTTPGKVAEQKDFIRRLVAGEAITSFETQRVTKDGRVLDVWMTVTKLMDDAGKPIGLASTERDITARKREEENLRRMATVVRDSNDAITIQNFEGGITAWNRGAELMYGYSEAEALLANIDRLTTPDKVAEQKDFIRRLVAGEAITSFETQRVTKDGRVLDVWMTVTKLMDDAGKPIGLASTERDITTRKQAEAMLQQSSREVQEKNSEMERFLYTASHDLKSPVVTVRTFLGYLEQDMVEAKAERVAKDMLFIRAAADKMAQLLDDLLELSRIGRIVNLPVRVTLRALVDEARAAVAGRIAQRGVTVKVGEQDVTLYGDRLRLAEIWQNLVENACKFMGDQKEPCIDIGVEPRDAEMVFFVRDNGIGIDPRFQAKVFGLFEKLDAKAEGTGLGLAIVKRIVDLYGGRIWVESAGQGQGTCLYFTLPGTINKKPKEGAKA